MVDKYWHVKRSGLFGALGEEALRSIESCSRTRDFPARSPILLPEDGNEHLFLVVKGLVKIGRLSREGKAATLSLVEAGEVFGELAVWGDVDPEQHVEAIEATTLLMIPVAAVGQVMERHPEFIAVLTRMLGLRQRRIERRLANLLFRSHRDRLIHLLLDLAEQFGERVGEGCRIRVRLTHEDLGNLIGSTRESVTVVLGHLRNEGIVTIGRRQVFLTSPGELASQVDRHWHFEWSPLTSHSRLAWNGA